jgi:hypothetical protein
MNTSRFWVPADETLPIATEAMGAMQALRTLSRNEFIENRELPAAERRLITPGFVQAFQWDTIETVE